MINHSPPVQKSTLEGLYDLVRQRGVKDLATNLGTAFDTIDVRGVRVPFMVNHGDAIGCYMTSVSARYFRLGGEELARQARGKLTRHLGRFITRLTPVSTSLGLDRVVVVNNAVLDVPGRIQLSTASHQELVERLQRRFPKNAIVFRGFDPHGSDTARNIVQTGGIPIANRRAFIADLDKLRSKRGKHITSDIRHAHKRFDVIDSPGPDSDSSYSWVREAYEDLYLKKYTRLHPQFTENWFRLSHDQAFIRYLFLFDSVTADAVGFASYYVVDETLYLSNVGYKTKFAKLRPLRAIFGIVFERALTGSNQWLHMGGGNAEFKQYRSGKLFREYAGVYANHLPGHRRMVWTSAATLFNASVRKHFNTLDSR
jgi:hypothetical protein